MGDQCVDLSNTESNPPLPPKTYQWEDVRRQKLEGCYPWTYLNKEPFDNDVWEKTTESEYEPVGKMEKYPVKKVCPPVVKITEISDTQNQDESNHTESSSVALNKQFLQIPCKSMLEINEEEENETSDDDEESDEEEMETNAEEITAQILQSRLDETFFSNPEINILKKNQTYTFKNICDNPEPSKDTNKTQKQTNRLKQKFQNFKEAQTKEKSEPKSTKLKDKLKFNIKKPNINLPERILPSMPSLHLPNKPNISFPNLHFLSKSNNCDKETKDSTSHTSTDQSKCKFDFGTYPRIFKRKRKIVEDDYEQIEPYKPGIALKAESVPNTPILKRSNTFRSKLLNKFKDLKNTNEKITKKNDMKEPEVIKSSISISLRETKQPPEKEEIQEEEKPTEMIIDNKNFFFISLHEDRQDLPPKYNYDLDSTETNAQDNNDFSQPNNATAPAEEQSNKLLTKLKQLKNKDSLWHIALKNTDSIKKSSEEPSKASKESVFSLEESNFNEAVLLDEQVVQNEVRNDINDETEIKEISRMDESVVSSTNELSTSHFEEYESALERSKLSSDYYSTVEIGKCIYSSQNALVRLNFNESQENVLITPVRPKRTKIVGGNNSENQTHNGKDDSNGNYNTFPLIKPHKPRRRLKKPRKYSNSNNNVVDNQKKLEKIDDTSVNHQIANSKQLSVSFLPLSCNIVDDNISCYNLRETLSMVDLNMVEPTPPIPPPKRKKSLRTNTYKQDLTQNSTLNRPISASMLAGDTFECRLDYADSTGTRTPDYTETPVRPYRKRFVKSKDNTCQSLECVIPEDGSYRRSSGATDESKEINGYAVVGKSTNTDSHKSNYHIPKRSSSNVSEKETIINKFRRISNSFTLPRMRRTENYISQAGESYTLDRRAQSPSRPPRKSRSVKEPIYAEDFEENQCTPDEAEFHQEMDDELIVTYMRENDLLDDDDSLTNLQSGHILQKMQRRPLPPPPRPQRKTKDDIKFLKSDTVCYSQCQKNKNQLENENSINILNKTREKSIERKIINTTLRLNNKPPEGSIRIQTEPSVQEANVKNDLKSNFFENKTLEPDIKVVKAQTLQVSELNVTKLNICEIESSKLVTSNIDSVSLNVSDVQSECGKLRLNTIELPVVQNAEHHTCNITKNMEQCSKKDYQDDNKSIVSDKSDARQRIDSMIPEVGSDDESNSYPKNDTNSSSTENKNDHTKELSPTAEPQNPTLSELTYQILQICQSSVGQAIHSMIEQLLPEEDKRNDVQVAIWIITIIVAGCLVLGLGSEKTIHHHHWDFHFPPPH